MSHDLLVQMAYYSPQYCLYPAYKNSMADISESSIFNTNSRLICLVAVSMLNKHRWMTL